MEFSDSLLRLSIKNWAAHQQPPDRDFDRLIRQARYSNLFLARKKQPRRVNTTNDTKLWQPQLSLERLLSPLSLANNVFDMSSSNLENNHTFKF